MGMRGWGTGIVVVLVWVRLTCAAEHSRASSPSTVCPAESVADSILGCRFRNWSCPLDGDSESLGLVAVTEVSVEFFLLIFWISFIDISGLVFCFSWLVFLFFW